MRAPEKMSAPADDLAYVEKCGPPAEDCTAADLEEMDFTVTCSNMNEGVFTATNTMPMPMDICVQEGLVLECVDGSAQDCMCVRGCTLHLPAANVFASLWGGAVATPVSAPIRLAA